MSQLFIFADKVTSDEVNGEEETFSGDEEEEEIDFQSNRRQSSITTQQSGRPLQRFHTRKDIALRTYFLVYFHVFP